MYQTLNGGMRVIRWREKEEKGLYKSVESGIQKTTKQIAFRPKNQGFRFMDGTFSVLAVFTVAADTLSLSLSLYCNGTFLFICLFIYVICAG